MSVMFKHTCVCAGNSDGLDDPNNLGVESYHGQRYSFSESRPDGLWDSPSYIVLGVKMTADLGLEYPYLESCFHWIVRRHAFMLDGLTLVL